MQGTLNEIDIRSILQLIELGQRTGQLLVEAYPSTSNSQGIMSHFSRTKSKPPGPFWFVFFLNGEITYAAESNDSLLRLKDYLRRYRADTMLDMVSLKSIQAMNATEYGYLWMLLERHVLTPEEGRSIIASMVHETLFDLLSLHQGSFIFEMGPALEPQLTTLPIATLVTSIMKQVQEWKQFHPHIQCPDQYPILTNASELRAVLPENVINMLEQHCKGTTTLRQLARYLNRDLVTVSRAIYPYIKQGWIQLLNQMKDQTPNDHLDVEIEATPPRIICIDDDITINKAVESILSNTRYKFYGTNNPLEALTLVFRNKADLVLCDITMPELEGYEICGMLRQSQRFRHTPIIMLTGRDGFIDRVRARMVGATDYLTKPFGEQELLTLLEKHLNSSMGQTNLSYSNSNKLTPII